MKKLHLVKENYHGIIFKGNECSKINKNLQVLEWCLVKEEVVKEVILALEEFKEFSNSCCGTAVKINWENVIGNFKNSYKLLQQKYNISVQNKIHIIIGSSCWGQPQCIK